MAIEQKLRSGEKLVRTHFKKSVGTINMIPADAVVEFVEYSQHGDWRVRYDDRIIPVHSSRDQFVRLYADRPASKSIVDRALATTTMRGIKGKSQAYIRTVNGSMYVQEDVNTVMRKIKAARVRPYEDRFASFIRPDGRESIVNVVHFVSVEDAPS